MIIHLRVTALEVTQVLVIWCDRWPHLNACTNQPHAWVDFVNSVSSRVMVQLGMLATSAWVLNDTGVATWVGSAGVLLGSCVKLHMSATVTLHHQALTCTKSGTHQLHNPRIRTLPQYTIHQVHTLGCTTLTGCICQGNRCPKQDAAAVTFSLMQQDHPTPHPAAAGGTAAHGLCMHSRPPPTTARCYVAMSLAAYGHMHLLGGSRPRLHSKPDLQFSHHGSTHLVAGFHHLMGSALAALTQQL